MVQMKLFRVAAAAAAMAITTQAQASGERDYKCYVLDLTGAPDLVLFQTRRALPERIGGDEIPLSVLPGSVRPGTSRVIECALSQLAFENPAAGQLDRDTPR